MQNPRVQTLIVPQTVRRPIFLLGLSESTDYIQKYAERAQDVVRRHNFTGAFTIYSVHFSPSTPIERGGPPNWHSWIVENDPILTVGWVDETGLATNAAEEMLDTYWYALFRMGYYADNRERNACLEFSKKVRDAYDGNMERVMASSYGVQRVRQVSATCPPFHSASYFANEPGGEQNDGIGFPVMVYRIIKDATPSPEAEAA
jgi:hypothetical protein